MSRTSTWMILPVLCAIAVPPAAAGQAVSPAKSRIPVTVVFADDAASPGQSIIKRFGGSNARDVIVLRSDASSAELSQAIRGLLLTRQISGDLPAANGSFRLAKNQRTQPARKEFPLFCLS